MKKNNQKIALFMLPLLTLGSGAEKYFIDLARGLCERGIISDVITLDEKFYKKFARALHIFFSFNFFKPIDISGQEKEESIERNLGQAKWLKTSFGNLKKNLNNYDAIYSKNELADFLFRQIQPDFQ